MRIFGGKGEHGKSERSDVPLASGLLSCVVRTYGKID